MNRKWQSPCVLSIACMFLAFSAGCGTDETVTPTDTAPPGTVVDLYADASPLGEVTLFWTAPGDDGSQGRASRYDVRYATTHLSSAQWDSASVVASPPIPRAEGQPERLTVADLPDSIWYFALRTADEVPNWSPWSNVVTVALGDRLAPSTVSDLSIAGTTRVSVSLSWTAPGDDGLDGQAMEYDLRYALAEITEATWTAATRAPGVPAPKAGRSGESFTIPEMTTGETYFFALKTVDEKRNWSGLSNVVSATLRDGVAPARVADLAVSAATAHSVTLTWTAPGNDGAEGKAQEYDLRYSFDAIYEGNWDAAQRAPAVPAPDSAGTAESFTVLALEPAFPYYFALRTADQSANWSPLSNVVNETTIGIRRLTHSPAGSSAGSPAWSPDGRSLLFSADWSGLGQIYRMPADGGAAIQLTHTSNHSGFPSWSPDGQEITYSCTPSDAELGLWKADAASGANPVLLARPERGSILWNSWSPDGTRIVYSVQAPDALDLYIMSSSGGLPVLHVHEEDVMYADPDWSPDGSQIAFFSNLGTGFGWKIWRMSATGEDKRMIYGDGSLCSNPSWSPDGSRIAFRSTRARNGDLWSVSAEGIGARQLTFHPEEDGDPDWSPDGRRIAFTSSRSGSFEIWILEVE